MDERPIANKYREGKMKRTLKRELKSAWNCWEGRVWRLRVRPGLCVSHEPLYVLDAGQHRSNLGGTTTGIDTLSMPPDRSRCEGRPGPFMELRPQDAGRMLPYHPSWNTDQGVQQLHELVGCKPMSASNLTGGMASRPAPSTDHELLRKVWVRV